MPATDLASRPLSQLVMIDVQEKLAAAMAEDQLATFCCKQRNCSMYR